MNTPVTKDPVLDDVERFLHASQMSATSFGRQSVSDPMLVHQLRQGRECKRSTRARILGFIQEFADSVQPKSSDAALLVVQPQTGEAV
jgi:2,4-dienoyl-CoA reductase-like NADH-dependent reductase (Old Yellow Enzyme family)